jgi:hypothetical protein
VIGHGTLRIDDFSIVIGHGTLRIDDFSIVIDRRPLRIDDFTIVVGGEQLVRRLLRSHRSSEHSVNSSLTSHR